MVETYREMLTYIKSVVTRNYSEKCLNNIMNFVSGPISQNYNLLLEFYQTTLNAFEEAKNEVWDQFCPIKLASIIYTIIFYTHTNIVWFGLSIYKWIKCRSSNRRKIIFWVLNRLVLIRTHSKEVFSLYQ